MQIRHYYHCYAGGAWAAPVRDHFTALGRAGLDDMTLTVGLVGSEQDRKACREMINLRCNQWVLPQPARWVEADQGWEQVTMTQIYHDVREIPGDYAVLYCHTKGAYNDSNGNAAWRRSMTAKVVGEWEECVELLAQGYDAVGPHWMSQHGDWFFAGTFWWARASHLRRLPVPENETRWTPEVWVSLPACPNRKAGMAPMRFHSLIDGPPNYGN